MLNIITFIALYVSGVYVGVFVPTFIENFSKPFRQFIRKITNEVPYNVRRPIMFAMLFIMAMTGYFVMPFNTTMNGILCGFVAGWFVYLRAGVTLGEYQPAEDDIFAGTNDYKGKKSAKNVKTNKYKDNKKKKTEIGAAEEKTKKKPKMLGK